MIVAVGQAAGLPYSTWQAGGLPHDFPLNPSPSKRGRGEKDKQDTAVTAERARHSAISTTSECGATL